MRIDRGFSLLELLAASFLALLVLAGAFYVYKSQYRNMLVKTSIAEMRMNGQYALNEAQYYLMHAGMGLPPGLICLAFSDSNLVVKSNPSKKGFAARKLPLAVSTEAGFRLDNPADAKGFENAAYVAVPGQRDEKAVLAFSPSTGVLRLQGDWARFPDQAILYPLARMEIRRESDGRFRIREQRPGFRPDSADGSLTLAEGIDRLRYRFISKSGARSGSIPVSLDTLERIEIRLTARAQYQDPRYRGDGYRREDFSLVTGYKRSL